MNEKQARLAEKIIKAFEADRLNDAGNPGRGLRLAPKGTFYGVEKSGTIWAFDPFKNVGSIIDGDNSRYFFNKINIISGKPDVAVGDAVRFFIDPTRPVRPNHLPIAYGIAILTPKTGIDVLVDKTDTPEVR